MSHFIVKIRSDSGQESYGHIQLDDQDATMLLKQPHIVSVEAGPCDTAEAAWIEWHKKHGNL